MSIANTARFLLRHELTRERPLQAIGRWLRWQAGSRLLPGAVALPFVGGTRLLARRGMTGATGNYYCGLHEFNDMAFVLHLLRAGDCFVDVGANIGSYTVLAAGACGARVIAIEPSPATHEALLDNIRLNRLEDRVQAHAVLLGGAPGTQLVSTGLDTVNHVLTQAERGTMPSVERPVATLDSLAADSGALALKVDVEGFETEVIRGGGRLLQSRSLQAVVMELDGSGSRYGFDESALHRHMVESGFALCRYEGRSRSLVALASKERYRGNSLYVRDLGFVRERLQSAPRRVVVGALI